MQEPYRVSGRETVLTQGHKRTQQRVVGDTITAQTEVSRRTEILEYFRLLLTGSLKAVQGDLMTQPRQSRAHSYRMHCIGLI